MFYSPVTSIFVANYSVHPWKIIHRVAVRKIYFGCCIVVLFQFFIGGDEAGWMDDCIRPEWINACPRKRERKKRGFSCSFKITYVAVDQHCHVTIQN